MGVINIKTNMPVIAITEHFNVLKKNVFIEGIMRFLVRKFSKVSFV